MEQLNDNKSFVNKKELRERQYCRYHGALIFVPPNSVAGVKLANEQFLPVVVGEV